MRIKSFQEYINSSSIDEALHPSQAKSYIKAWKEAGGEKFYRDIFGKKENGKPKYRLYLELEESEEQKQKISKDVRDRINKALEYTNYEVENFNKNIAVSDKRTTSIIKVLMKDSGLKKSDINVQKLKSDYEKELNKKSTQRKQDNYLVVISRHPYDIAGMSTDRGWTSCMDLDTGGQTFHIMEDVKKGTIIAYLIKKDDLNINNPVARVLIKPYVSEDSEEIALFRDNYKEIKGEPVKGFKETIDAWLEKNQKLSKSKYKQLKGLYDEGRCAYNPDASIEAILNDFVKGTFEVDGNTISVNGDVNLRRKLEVFKKITKNYKFGYVSGDFYCSNNDLTSLEGAPEEVGGNFNCEYNKLTSLEGAPGEVGGDFDCKFNNLRTLEGSPEKVGSNFSCIFNKLTTLEGAPGEVGGDFDCSHNNLASLEDAPKKVGGEFNCLGNSLTSLKGAPEKVGGKFNCSGNQLTSLEGAPEKVGDNFICRSNKLTSLEGAPEKVGGSFICYRNDLTSLKGTPKKVGDDFYCMNNKLTSLDGGPEEVGGRFDCSHNKLTSLDGAPKKIGSDFSCTFNKLTSLQSAPEKVGGDFDCRFNRENFTKEDVKAVSDVEGEIKV
jgi:hypothetical protein